MLGRRGKLWKLCNHYRRTCYLCLGVKIVTGCLWNWAKWRLISRKPIFKIHDILPHGYEFDKKRPSPDEGEGLRFTALYAVRPLEAERRRPSRQHVA